jgi:hypothetical protein
MIPERSRIFEVNEFRKLCFHIVVENVNNRTIGPTFPSETRGTRLHAGDRNQLDLPRGVRAAVQFWRASLRFSQSSMSVTTWSSSGAL